MKKQIVKAAVIIFTAISCEKSVSKTESVENPDGSVTTTTITETSNTDLVDSAKINKVKGDIKSKADEAGDKISDVAQEAKDKIDATTTKTKDEFHKAGQEIKSEVGKVEKDAKEAAKKGASKVEDAAKKLKEDLSK